MKSLDKQLDILKLPDLIIVHMMIHIHHIQDIHITHNNKDMEVRIHIQPMIM